jgi:hypothetical protein
MTMRPMISMDTCTAGAMSAAPAQPTALHRGRVSVCVCLEPASASGQPDCPWGHTRVCVEHW